MVERLDAGPSGAIVCEDRGPIRIIRFSHPQKRNALSRLMLDELRAQV